MCDDVRESLATEVDCIAAQVRIAASLKRAKVQQLMPTSAITSSTSQL